MGNAPIQMGIQTHKHSYRAGDTITGTVYLKVSSLTDDIRRYQGIHLSLQGHEHAQVRTRQETHSSDRRHQRDITFRTERASASVVHMEVPLVTKFHPPLRVAQYEFPFEWKLPASQECHLPSSFCTSKSNDTGHCEVVYRISAYLTPQRTTPCAATKDGTTRATQVLQIVGGPTRPSPEPLELEPESTVVNGMCCCWRQGLVEVGWSANNAVLSPGETCQLQIVGQNLSHLEISALRVQLLETTQWHAPPGDAEGGSLEQRKVQTRPVDFLVSVQGRPQWMSSNQNRGAVAPAGYTHLYSHDIVGGGMNPRNRTENDPNRIFTSFRIPLTVHDTYLGQFCQIQHCLVVSCQTRILATKPQLSHPVFIQQPSSTTSSSTTTATATVELDLPVATVVHDYFASPTAPAAAVLPADWTPDETVPVIKLSSVTAISTTASDNLPTAMAHAVEVEPSAPTEEQVLQVTMGKFT